MPTTSGGASGSDSTGSYGGLGYESGSSNALYGDFRNPNEVGSGGDDYRGGGLVRLIATNLIPMAASTPMVAVPQVLAIMVLAQEEVFTSTFRTFHQVPVKTPVSQLTAVRLIRPAAVVALPFIMKT